MRPQLHDVAVLDRARLALVGVDDDVARPGLLRDRVPLRARGEARAPVAGEAGRLQLVDDPLERRQVAQELEAAARRVVRERRVALSQPDRRAVLRRVGHRGDDLVAARQHGRDVAVTEAGDLDRAGISCEELVRPEAVADRARAHPHGVRRHLQERVERDDLVHFAAPDVHVVGERVRQLHRDRADLPADAAEVVEKPRSLRRKLGKERCEPERVHVADPTSRPGRDDANGQVTSCYKRLFSADKVETNPSDKLPLGHRGA